MGITDQAHKDFDFEIVDEFLDHFEVMKDAMQPAILALETLSEYPRKIDELFRIFHNLKSASAFLRFDAMHRLSGFVENSLDYARQEAGPASEKYIDWLLKVADQYDLWFVDIVNNRDRFTALNFQIFDTPHFVEHKGEE